MQGIKPATSCFQTLYTNDWAIGLGRDAQGNVLIHKHNEIKVEHARSIFADGSFILDLFVWGFTPYR